MQNLAQEISGFTGTESYHRLSMIARFNSTDGVKHVADTYGAYWLVDAIASYQHERKVSEQEFQVWKLEVTQRTKGNKAVLTMTDGNSDTPIVTQKIPFTDFPETISFFLRNNVLMLTSEY